MPLLNIVWILLALWAVPWKIYAVWLACKREQKIWFVALIFLNTIGILEIFYIFHVAKKPWPEVKADFKSAWTWLRMRKQKKTDSNGTEIHHV